MCPGRDDEERERPSWREIDQRRDRSRHGAPGRRPKVTKKQAELERRAALQQAEALFKGKRARPEYQAALKKLEAHHQTKHFPATAQKFLKEYGLPEEWGALNLLLDYPHPEAVEEVLQAMAAQTEARSRVEKQGFKARLQILALTCQHAGLRRLAEEILGAIK